MQCIRYSLSYLHWFTIVYNNLMRPSTKANVYLPIWCSRTEASTPPLADSARTKIAVARRRALLGAAGDNGPPERWPPRLSLPLSSTADGTTFQPAGITTDSVLIEDQGAPASLPVWRTCTSNNGNHGREHTQLTAAGVATSSSSLYRKTNGLWCTISKINSSVYHMVSSQPSHGDETKQSYIHVIAQSQKQICTWKCQQGLCACF